MDAPRTARDRVRRDAPPKDRKKLLYTAIGFAAIAGATLLVLKVVFVGDPNVRHRLDTPPLAADPRGEPVRVAYGVKAGDVFVSKVESRSSILLSHANVDTNVGMYLDSRFQVAHEVVAKGGATASSVRVLLDRADSQHAPTGEAIWVTIGDRHRPYTVAFDRDAEGRPLRATASDGPAGPVRRIGLDGVTSGLGDLATNWLPARDVRLGEVWDVAEVADVAKGVEGVVRRVAQRDLLPGYPKADVKGWVRAESVERKVAEECLRLSIRIHVLIEGEVVHAVYGGWISAVARLDAKAWVSLSTGIVWALEIESEVASTHRAETVPLLERHATSRLSSSTDRAERVPE